MPRLRAALPLWFCTLLRGFLVLAVVQVVLVCLVWVVFCFLAFALFLQLSLLWTPVPVLHSSSSFRGVAYRAQVTVFWVLAMCIMQVLVGHGCL